MWTRQHYLWILLVLLLVCIAIQTFVAHQASDKLTGHLRFTVSQQHLFPTLRNMWAGLHPKSSLSGNQDAWLLHTQSTAELAKEGHADSLWKHVDESMNISTSHQTRKVPPGKLLGPQNRNQPGYPDSLVLRHPAQAISPGTDKRLVNAPTRNVPINATCSSKSHVVFLKTHKTASSTILNILYRYGESRNLTFALPLNRHSQLFYPYPFATHFVEGIASRSVKEFHIICNHMRFRKSEVAKVMPKDSFYFSILRNPVAMMESIFIYYKSIPAFHKAHSLDDFLDNNRVKYNASVAGNHYAHNILAFDFGFENNIAENATDFEQSASMAIAAIERDFHLILISEYFDESMVLLKHALCWSLEDVVSFKLNSRSERSRCSLLPSTAEKIKRWNSLDWRIYLHFNTTFWHKVDSLVGQEQMRKEMYELRELQGKLARTCLRDGGAVDPSQVKDTSLKPFQYGAAVIQGYNLNPYIDKHTKTRCQRLITPELQYTERLYTQQFPNLSAKPYVGSKKMAPHHHHSERSGLKGTALDREAIRRSS
ncbi:galactose-3-O-sulfotransferase 2 isoform X2 [Betta splendens]|nr:galactose-3-O-sulfotransferase 2 isoform X2 [Betta splendens]